MKQVFRGAQLAGGVPGHRQQQLFWRDAAAVIRHFDQALPGLLDVDGDLAGAGIQAFSSSSLTTEAGRSTTSPAAICEATSSGRNYGIVISYQKDYTLTML